jgi:hypothetical protein
MLASVEDEDPVARVGRDAGDLDEAPPIGQHSPAFASLKARLIAYADRGTHASNSRAVRLIYLAQGMW